MIRTALTLAALFATLATAVCAAPALRSEVTVVGPIVTVGDMFDDAGLLAERGLFRSPLPGTAGTVTLDQVRQAAAAAGLGDYVSEGVMRVRVTRPATIVDAQTLAGLIADELGARGLVREGTTLDVAFDGDPTFAAEAVDPPAHLLAVSHTPGSTAFSARLLIAGHDAPVAVSGHLALMTQAPHLVATRPAGFILSVDDVELRPVPVAAVDESALPDIHQLIGKQLNRQSRAGMMLKASDVAAPTVVERNAVVTLLLASGPMRLTARGQALTSAAAGQAVQVLNTASRKLVIGIAQPDGTVLVAPHLDIAGL